MIEITNTHRARWARVALRHYMLETNIIKPHETNERASPEYEAALGDLLCNLMHLADLDDRLPSFDEALRLARSYYAEEVEEERA